MHKPAPHTPAQSKSLTETAPRQTMTVNLHAVPPLHPNTYKRLRDELKGRNIMLRLE